MIDWLEGDRAIPRLRRAVYVLLAAGFLAFLARGADRPADPALRPAPTTVPASPAPAPAPGG